MSDHKQNNDHHESGHHLVPTDIYFKVWGSLILFTILTVVTSYIDFGGHLNIIIAMFIATCKALLVTNFFMGLKYDSKENNVTFYLSFLFLVIFIALAGSDVFTRKDLNAANVDKSALIMSGDAGGADISTMLKSNAELVSKGKAIYSAQCVACHGANGLGDGPAAAAMNPKPRNFTAVDGWKIGRKTANVFKTLSEGIPGTSMPGFGSISAADRISLAHYVRSLMTNAPAESEEDLKALAASAGGPTKQQLPIDFIIDRMTNSTK